MKNRETKIAEELVPGDLIVWESVIYLMLSSVSKISRFEVDGVDCLDVIVFPLNSSIDTAPIKTWMWKNELFDIVSNVGVLV